MRTATTGCGDGYREDGTKSMETPMLQPRCTIKYGEDDRGGGIPFATIRWCPDFVP